jgi:hypothetical protein
MLSWGLDKAVLALLGLLPAARALQAGPVWRRRLAYAQTQNLDELAVAWGAG